MSVNEAEGPFVRLSGDWPAVAEKARRLGPLRYSALGRQSGGPELPVEELARWEATALDQWWDSVGRPDPYTVVEVGAGDASRAREILRLGPNCLTALRLVLVEDDDSARAAQKANVAVESPALFFPAGRPDPDALADPDEERPPATGIGPLVTSLGEAPVLKGFAVVLAAGWVSRLPSDLLEWRDGRWWEIRLAAAGQAGGSLVEIPVPLSLDPEGRTGPSAVTRSFQAAGPPAQGARVAVQDQAAQWLAGALRIAETGALLVIDRWTQTTEPQPGRDSAGGSRAGREPAPPVALDQMTIVRRPVEPAPTELFGGLSSVTWRLG
jgi:Putative S-adenosyl-L-methionine-dependent methyltransferase